MIKTTVYITRDSNGDLSAFYLKPVKGLSRWQKGSEFNACFPLRECDLPDCVNPSWKDEEPIVATMNLKAHKHFKMWMWLCCDKDGKIYIFHHKPAKHDSAGEWLSDTPIFMEIPNFDDYFPHVRKPTWNDDEQIAVRMNLDELTSDSIGHNI
jgi:hypothetical protein